jgi:hypothetical protein
LVDEEAKTSDRNGPSEDRIDNQDQPSSLQNLKGKIDNFVSRLKFIKGQQQDPTQDNKIESKQENRKE